MPSPPRFAQRAFVRLAMSVLAAGWLTTAPAQVLVNDPGAIGAQVQHMGKDAVEFGKQAQRWRETVAHFRQQLVGLRRLNFAPAQMRDDFAARPDDYGMDDLCRVAAPRRESARPACCARPRRI